MDMLAPILRVILVVIATLIDERKVERYRERIVVWTIVLGVAVAVLWWSRRYR